MSQVPDFGVDGVMDMNETHGPNFDEKGYLSQDSAGWLCVGSEDHQNATGTDEASKEGSRDTGAPQKPINENKFQGNKASVAKKLSVTKKACFAKKKDSGMNASKLQEAIGRFLGAYRGRKPPGVSENSSTGPGSSSTGPGIAEESQGTEARAESQGIMT